MIFDTAGLAPRTLAQFDYALSRCDFPWELLRPGMQAKNVGQIDIRIETDMTDAAAASVGWMSLNPQALGSLEDGTFGITHENGHMVDYFYLTDEMRRQILDIMHEEMGGDCGRCGNDWNGNRSPDTTIRTKYLEQPSEAWAEIFACGAFSDYKSTGFRYTHFVKDPARQARIRQIVLPGAKPFVSEMSTVTKLFRLRVSYKQGGSIAKGFLTPWTSMRRLGKYIELDSETIVGLRDHTGKAGHKVEVIGKAA